MSGEHHKRIKSRPPEVTQEMLDGWFEAYPQRNEVIAFREPYHDEDVFCYLVKGQTKDLLIDTGMGVGQISSFVNRFRNPFKPLVVVNSHWHFDHIGGDGEFNSVLVPKSEGGLVAKGWTKKDLEKYSFINGFIKGLPTGFEANNFEIPQVKNVVPIIDDKWSIDLGDRKVRAIETPGHTPGSVSFFDETHGLLFSSDLLYEGPLYAFEGESDPKQYLRSLEKLRDTLGDKIKLIHPGHNFANNVNEPNLLYEAIWLFERITRKETPDAESTEFPNVVEYRHPLFYHSDPEKRRRLRAMIKRQT